MTLFQLMKEIPRGIVLLLLSMSLVLPALAADLEEEDHEKPYLGRLASRLERGVSNVFHGVGELPAGIEEIGNKHGFGAAATWGVIHGAGRAVQRTAMGIFEILTSPLGVTEELEPIGEPKTKEHDPS